MKEKRKQRTIEEKYEIIKFFESIESQGRGAKEITRKRFEISTISSLNVILKNRDDILRLHESNQFGNSRVRLTPSRLPTLDKKLYESLTYLGSNNVEMKEKCLSLGSKNGQVSTLDFVNKAVEIKEKLLSDNELNEKEKKTLANFKITSGFIKKFKHRHNIELNTSSGEAGTFKIPLKRIRRRRLSIYLS